MMNEQISPLLFEQYQLAASLLMTRQLEQIRLFDHHNAAKQHDELMSEISAALSEADVETPDAETPDPATTEQEIIKPFVPKPSKRNKFDRLSAIYNGNKQKGKRQNVY